MFVSPHSILLLAARSLFVGCSWKSFEVRFLDDFELEFENGNGGYSVLFDSICEWLLVLLLTRGNPCRSPLLS